MEKQITLKLNKQPVKFTINNEEHERLVNELSGGKKDRVTPMYNFLMRTVDQKDKKTLKPLVENPGNTAEVATLLLDEFTPSLKIEVGE